MHGPSILKWIITSLGRRLSTKILALGKSTFLIKLQTYSLKDLLLPNLFSFDKECIPYPLISLRGMLEHMIRPITLNPAINYHRLWSTSMQLQEGKIAQLSFMQQRIVTQQEKIAQLLMIDAEKERRITERLSLCHDRSQSFCSTRKHPIQIFTT